MMCINTAALMAFDVADICTNTPSLQTPDSHFMQFE